MTRYHELAYLLSLLLLLASCAKPYIPPDGYAFMPSESFTGCHVPWLASDGSLRMRQTVYVEFGNQSHVVQGLMNLDHERREARLVGLSEFGIKLFDLSVGRREHLQHALSPLLGGMGETLAAGVAQSVQRIFLSFPDMDSAQVYAGPESALIVHRHGNETVIHACESQHGRLTRTSSPDQRWEVDFAGYQSVNGFVFPKRIIYQDHRAGYRVILVLHEVFDP